MEFDIFNPDTWYLAKEDDVFHINDREVYTPDFSSRLQLKDFVRLLQHNINLEEQKRGCLSLKDKQEIIRSIVLSFYKNNTKEGVVEMNSKFDIFNESEWDKISDCPLVYKGELVMSEQGCAIRTGDFVNFMAGTVRLVRKKDKNIKFNKKFFENLLQKMLDSQHGKLKPKEFFVLTPETEDKTESGFNPLDKTTWNLASNKRIMRIKGVLIYYGKNEDGTLQYKSEKSWVRMTKMFVAAFEKQGEKEANVIIKQLTGDYNRCNPKDLEPVFTVNGFPFSKALCDVCRDTEKETLEKVANAMNYCKEQNFKKWQYKQHFFYERVPASQEFFPELYFAEQYGFRKDVDDLIVSFYCEFEPESKEEIGNILNESLYLNAHKELLEPVRKSLLESLESYSG